MILVRTDGSGSHHEDERLQLLKTMVEHYYRHHPKGHRIFKLHDHKGKLSVYWFETPATDDVEFMNDSWKYFYETEVEHYRIFVNERRIIL